MPVFKPLPSREALQERLFICETSPSGLRWRVARGRQPAGSIAGTKARHWVVNYSKHLCPAQRLIWVLHYGEDPGGKLVDHINRNPFDNRVSNLRLADHSDNAINVAMYRHNKTGVKGVSYHARDRVFFAQIKLQQKSIHLGSFKTLEDAANARRAAELALCGQFSALAP